MLTIEIQGEELFNNDTQEFVSNPIATIQFEHSLASISKWEETWEQAFLSDNEKTDEQTYDYILKMCLTDDVDLDLLKKLSPSNIQKITDYINSKRSATWFSDTKERSNSREIVTSEIIYYWMVQLHIPFECQYWHFNKLLTLIKVVSQKNAPAKKVGKNEWAAQQRAINEARRSKLRSSG